MARPKLKDGEKGNYNVSRKQQEQRKIQKRINVSKKTLQADSKKIGHKRESIKKNEERLKLLKNGGVTSDKTLGVVLEDNQELVFSPNAGPQTDFLAAPEKEVLYGGAAGGGKSYAMLVDLLRYANNRNHRALLLRRTLSELTELIDQSKKMYLHAFPKARFKESTKTWEFPSGATALFSYVDKDDDVYRYQGQSFTWIGIPLHTSGTTYAHVYVQPIPL